MEFIFIFEEMFVWLHVRLMTQTGVCFFNEPCRHVCLFIFGNWMTCSLIHGALNVILWASIALCWSFREGLFLR